MRILSGVLGILFSLASWAAPGVIYPINPNVADDAIFVAASGVTRLEADGLVPTWHTLDGMEPFDPVIADGLVLVGSPSGIFALDVKSGELIWHFDSDRPLFSPTIVGTTAYAGGEDGTLRAVDLHTGQEQWRHQLTGWVFSPAVVGDHLVTGGGDGMLWGLAAADGRESWHRELGEELIFHPVAGEDDPVYVSTSQGNVFALGAGTGELRWEARLATPTTTSVFGKRVFFVQYSGLITAHDRQNGRKLWEFQLEGPSSSPVRILDGMVLAVTDEGGSVMLDPENGEVVQELAPPPDEPPQELQPTGNQLMASLRY